MNRKNCLQKSLSLFIHAFAILFIFQMSSCKKGDNTANQSSLDNSRQEWLKLNIKFKAGSTESIREGIIKEVEKLIIGELNEMKENENHSFSPAFTIDKGSFQDTLHYQIHVNFFKDNGPQQSADGVGPSVPCKCPTCGICQKTNSLLLDSTHISKFVESFTTP